MADDLETSANNDTGAAGGEAEAPKTEGGETLLGGADPTPEKSGTEESAGESKETPAGPPEQYEAFKLPEGVELDKGLMEQVQAQFKAAGYTQAQAQAAVDLHIQNQKAQQEAWIKETEAWKEDLRKDPEFGGANMDKTVQDAKLALRRFDTDGNLGRLLEESRFGNRREAVVFLARVQRALGEDEVHTDRSRDKGKEPPLAERLYGKDGLGPHLNQ